MSAEKIWLRFALPLDVYPIRLRDCGFAKTKIFLVILALNVVGKEFFVFIHHICDFAEPKFYLLIRKRREREEYQDNQNDFIKRRSCYDLR